MTVYYLFHVQCTAIAQFDGVSVKFVTSWKTCVDKADERSSYIRFNVSVKRGLKPMKSLRLFFCFGGLCGVSLNLSLKV